MSDREITFSIIIPSYNEGNDVRLSIESALNQRRPAEEILVIDDSTDNTRDIIKQYRNKRVFLVEGPHKGCCGARNLGMQIAKGDVAVLLNADVTLPPDFLDRIAKHYENDADFVLVEASVLNQENLYARFVEVQQRKQYRHRDDILWTEGFSCRISSARKVGFIPGEFSITFCRDWFLGKVLHEAGFKKVIDRSIIVRHKAPDTFEDYWRVRKARGRFSALAAIYLLKRNDIFLGVNFIFKDLIKLFRIILILPFLYKVVSITCHSDRRLKDVLPFIYTYFIQEVAFSFGEWEGLFMRRVNPKPKKL